MHVQHDRVAALLQIGVRNYFPVKVEHAIETMDRVLD